MTNRAKLELITKGLEELEDKLSVVGGFEVDEILLLECLILRYGAASTELSLHDAKLELEQAQIHYPA